jgi:hypothetical protein
MKTNVARTVSLVTWALVCVATVTTALVSARGVQGPQGEQRPARTLEGVWDVTVSVLNPSCQPGDVNRTVRARNMFMRGGTMTEEPALTNLITRSPSFGSWSLVGDHQYTAVFRFPRFNPIPIINPDGSLSFMFRDTQKVSRTIELNQAGTRFAASALVEHFDANNNLIDTGCATEIATRLE